ncbi:MAG: response regulator [Anaerolineales bacterium]|nr:response regulator [Anaerolineales bacterium]
MTSILIVDDDPDMAELLGHMTDILGHAHRYARNAQEALAAIAARQPDAIVLDVMLEHTDGWTLYDQLQRITDAPIIFITAWRTGENRRRAEALRADGFLAKPISHQDYAAALERVLGRPARRLPAGR